MNCPRCQTPLPPEAVYCPKCGMMSAPTPAGPTLSGQATIVRPLSQTLSTRLTAGAVFADRYEITGRLGEGGMGIVYSAKDQTSGLELVLKLIHPDLVQGEAAVRRLMTEGLTAREIRHPNIVAVFDVSQWHGQPYFTMEYVRGRNLRAWHVENVNKGLDVTLETAITLIRGILAGLAEAHRLGIVHRDLKPENILLKGDPSDADFRVKIVDFGIAKAVGASRTSKTSFGGGGGAGTPFYMAPEQLTTSEGIKPAADFYSLSVIFYELLMDAVPQSRFEAVSKHRPDVPAAIEALIERGLSVKAKSRPQTAAEYEAAIDTALTGSAGGAVVPPPLPPKVEPPASHQPPEPAPPAVASPPVPSVDPVSTPARGKLKPWIRTLLEAIGVVGVSLVAAGTSYDSSRDMTVVVYVGAAAFLVAVAVGWKKPTGQGVADDGFTSWRRPTLAEVGVGAVAGLLSTVGGPLVPLTAALVRSVTSIPHHLLPGTAYAASLFPIVVFGLMNPRPFVTDGDPFLVIGAALGAWFGASFLHRLPRRWLLTAMGVGLLLPLTAFLMLSSITLTDHGSYLHTSDVTTMLTALSLVAGAVSTAMFDSFGVGLVTLALAGGFDTWTLELTRIVGVSVVLSAACRFATLGAYARGPALGVTIGALPGLVAGIWVAETFGPHWSFSVLVGGITALSGLMLLRVAFRTR